MDDACADQYSFRPQLDPQSRKRYAHVKSRYSNRQDLMESIRQEQEKKAEYLLERRRELEEERIADCTFAPRVAEAFQDIQKPVVVSGLDRYFELKNLAQRKQQEQKEREQKIFRPESVAPRAAQNVQEAAADMVGFARLSGDTSQMDNLNGLDDPRRQRVTIPEPFELSGCRKCEAQILRLSVETLQESHREFNEALHRLARRLRPGLRRLSPSRPLPGRKLRNVARDAKVALHPTTEQLFCSGCSQVYIPGSNCRVSVQPLRKRKRTRKKPSKAERRAKPTKTGWTPGPKAKAEPEKPKRCVQYSCQWCGHRRRIRLPRRRAPRAAAAPTSFQSLNQKKQAAASQEARDAARAAKRQREAKAKAKAASEPWLH
ncbi:unnamed protein product [Effrenium voratum]|nr:unnamed protein product [Effrenium voratum]